jgi:CubicO group peptidase (beta-lactamase class C family)
MKRSLLILLIAMVIAVTIVLIPDPYADSIKKFDKDLVGKLGDDAAGFSMLITHNDRIIYEKYHGYANIEKKEALSKNHVLGIASMSKQFLGMTVVYMMNEGKIDLYEDIKTYLPDLPIGDRSITIKQLLSHTSGLPELTQNEVFMGSFSEPHRVQEIIDMAFLQDLKGEPGVKYEYNNTGYTIVTKVLEQQSGKTFSSLLNDIIFDPLNMEHSYCGDVNFTTDNLVVPRYYPGPEGYVPATKVHFSNMIGGGGVLSNVRDMMKWNKALLSGRKLPDNYKTIWDPVVLNNGDTISYGLGMGENAHNGHAFYYHPGTGDGMNAVNLVFPVENISIVVIQNVHPPKIQSIQAARMACDYLFPED